MRRLQALIVMVLLCSLFLTFFYASLNLSEVSSRRVLLEVIPNRLSLEEHAAIITTVHASQTNTTPIQSNLSERPVSKLVSISEAFREAVPKNLAYWNRILHKRLKNFDAGTYKAEKDNWSRCRVVNREILSTNIHDFGSYSQLQQAFVRGLECKDPPLLIDQPSKCRPQGGGGGGGGDDDDDDGQTFLLFALKSTPQHFERRQVVRETWGKEAVYEGGLRVRTVFLLGSGSMDDTDLSHLLSFEAKHFGDLLQWDFEDSLFNLSLKEHVFYQWSLKNCPNVLYVFKGDDDVFVNTESILGYLQTIQPPESSKAYIGQIISTASPLRDPKSKYYVPVSFYDGAYPAYAGGGGYIFSGALLGPLYEVSLVIPFFPIDDVYTGMCFQALGIPPTTHPDFRTFDIAQVDRDNICVHKHLLLVHQRSPQQAKRLWRGVHSPLLNC
ncbi:N-acetyllactosaminide beta-1,3-N-acetylglucosaminyltransferase 2 [Aplochiton taeniatus]